MFSQAFSSDLPISIIEEIFSWTIANVVKNFNIEELINYLKRKDLKLNEDNIKILCKEKISGHFFFKLTQKKLEQYSIKGVL